MPKLDKAIESFHNWIGSKLLEESHCQHGHFDDHNKALLHFLIPEGFRYVKTYEEVCELAVLLQKKGYKTTNPPCEPIDFAKAIEDAHPISFDNVEPVIPESVKIQLVAEHFKGWMECGIYQDNHRQYGHFDDHNEALLVFLRATHFQDVKTYEKLCELAVLLQKKGYKTTNPPCESIDFAKAIEPFIPEPASPESASTTCRLL